LARGWFCCEIVRCLLQTPRVYIYTLVLTRLLVDYEYNIHCLNQCPGANVHLAPVINSSLPYIRAPSSRIPESFLFKAQTALLPNDGALPTASIFAESFEENFLPNGASLPNSAHKLVPFPYQFLVLTEGGREIHRRHHPSVRGPNRIVTDLGMAFTGSDFPSANYKEGETQIIKGCQTYGEAASTISIDQNISQHFELFFKGFANPLWLPYLNNDNLALPCEFNFETVGNRMPVSLRGGGGELGNLRP
jgi:hypothetical protein